MRVPHMLEQLLGTDRGAVRGGQAIQHAELLAGQRQRHAVAACAVPGTVDDQVPALHKGG